MSWGPTVKRRENARAWHGGQRAALLLLGLLGLPAAVACEGCGEEPPTNGEPSMLITATSRQLEADGVSFVEVSVRAYDAELSPDNTAVTVTADGAVMSSEVHTVTNDGADLVGTPSEGTLTFRLTCPALEVGTVTLNASNGNAAASSTIECVEPTGTVTLAVLVDEDFPCTNLLADGDSFCVVPVLAERATANEPIPQAGLTLTAVVESATLTNPAEGEDATVTDLALLTPDSDGGQLPQDQLSITTDEDGRASVRVNTRLNRPMTINLRITGTAPSGQALSQTTAISVRPFESEATLVVNASPESIGSDLTTQIIITATDYQGEVPAADAVVTVSVPADSGAVLTAGGVDSVDGVVNVSITGGTALVTLDAPAVTEQETVTVTVAYRPHPSLPVMSEDVQVRIFPDNSLILNVETEPGTIQSDQNSFATLTASVMEFNQGNVVPKAGAQVRFTVSSLSRDLIGFGQRDDEESPALNDADFLLTTDVTTGSADPTNGIATVIVSSRNNRVRGTAEIDVQVIEGGEVMDSATITVSLTRDPILQSIVFVSATPQTLGVRGGAYPSSSVVTFKVFDDLAQSLPNVAMTFDLNATSDPEAVVVAQGMTDASGTVSTTVSAGTQAGPLSVVATAFFNGRQLTTESLPIAVTGGLPSFVNSYIQCDPDEQAQLSPATIDCTVVLADRFTNRAPANLPVQFRAEGGNIDPVGITDGEGAASATFVEGPPYGASTSLLSATGDSWSYGAVIPTSSNDTVEDDTTRWGVAAEAACFDANSRTPCSVFDLCFEADHAVVDLSDNDIYCPLLIDSNDDVGCWNKLEAGAVTRDAAHLSDGLLADLGLTRPQAQALLDTELTPQNYYSGVGTTADNVRRIIDAHLDNLFRCGAPTACITGFRAGVPFITGDECLVAPGCMDFNANTACPQDGLRTVTAIARGEESFTDLNGNGVLDFDDLDQNGRHNPGEPIRELGPNIDVPFGAVVLDMPEPFLDKDDNCFADDFTGSLRMTTYDAIRRTDVYSDEDGSGGYGYASGDPQLEPQLTNGQWDRDKQIFFSDHLLIVQGAPRAQVGVPCGSFEIGAEVTCPFNGADYLCEEAEDGTGVLVGCYPRVSDAVPVAPGTAIELRYRWVDANGNCYSPGFAKHAWAYDDSDYFNTVEDAERTFTTSPLTRAYCGISEYTVPRREWCDALPALGAPYFSQTVVTSCFDFEAGTQPSRRLSLVLTDAETFTADNTDVDGSFAVNFRLNCSAL